MWILKGETKKSEVFKKYHEIIIFGSKQIFSASNVFIYDCRLLKFTAENNIP